jgi:hypothetical protein
VRVCVLFSNTSSTYVFVWSPHIKNMFHQTKDRDYDLWIGDKGWTSATHYDLQDNCYIQVLACTDSLSLSFFLSLLFFWVYIYISVFIFLFPFSERYLSTYTNSLCIHTHVNLSNFVLYVLNSWLAIRSLFSPHLCKLHHHHHHRRL